MWKTAYFVTKTKSGKSNAKEIRVRNCEGGGGGTLGGEFDTASLPLLAIRDGERRRRENRMTLGDLKYENGKTIILSTFAQAIEVNQHIDPFSLPFHNLLTRSAPILCGAVQKSALMIENVASIPVVMRSFTTPNVFILLCLNAEDGNSVMNCSEQFISRATSTVDLWEKYEEQEQIIKEWKKAKRNAY